MHEWLLGPAVSSDSIGSGYTGPTLSIEIESMRLRPAAPVDRLLLGPAGLPLLI